MRAKIFKSNIAFGVLVAFVLALGVQGIVEALTLTRTSDRVQSNIVNSEFEITFSIGLKSDTTQIKNDDGKLVNDGGVQRIDSQGYTVTVIDGRDYRNTTITTAETSANQLVPPTPDTPDLPRGFQSSSSNSGGYADYSVHEKVSSSQYESYDGPIFAYSSKQAFSRRGYPLHYFTEGFMYDGSDTDTDEDDTAPDKVSVQIKIRDEQFATRTAKSNRYHYNDEAIAISVSTVAADGTLTATTDMTVRLKSGSTTYPVSVIGIPTTRPATPAALGTATASLWEGGGIRSLPSSITLVCTSGTAEQYAVTITDVSPANDFPDNAPETLEQAQIAFTLYVEDDAAPTGSLNFSEATGSLLRLETERPVEPIHTHFTLTTGTSLPANTSIRYKVTKGSGLLYVGTPTREDITPVSDLTIHKDAMVYLKVNKTNNEVVAAIAGQDLRTHGKTLVFEYTGEDRRSSGQQQQQQQQQTTRTVTPRLSISVADGATTTTRRVTVTATNAQGTAVSGLAVTLRSLTSGFTLSEAERSAVSGTAKTITVPTNPGDYRIQASVSGYTVAERTITVARIAPGTLTLRTVGSRSGTQQQFRVTASGRTIPSAGLVVRLHGVTLPSTVTIPSGSTSISRIATLSDATSAHSVYATATGYNRSNTLTIAAPSTQTTTTDTTTTTTTTTTTDTTTTVSEPARISAVGPLTRTGTANQALDTSLIVQVVDADGDAVEDTRVIFRVREGQGRLQERGNGRARAIQTNSQGHARVPYTPLSASSTVEAEVSGVSRTVTFTITTGSAPSTTETTGASRQYKTGDKIPLSLNDTLSFTGSRTVDGTTYRCVGSGACVISFGILTRGEIRASAVPEVRGTDV